MHYVGDFDAIAAAAGLERALDELGHPVHFGTAVGVAQKLLRRFAPGPDRRRRRLSERQRDRLKAQGSALEPSLPRDSAGSPRRPPSVPPSGAPAAWPQGSRGPT
jgi:hypothetical protein